MPSLIAFPLAWLLTYAVHSTVLLGLAFLLSRWTRLSIHTLDLVWKVALIGGLLTTSAQLAFNIGPRNHLSLAAAPVAPATPSVGNVHAAVREHDLASSPIEPASTFAAPSASNGSDAVRSPDEAATRAFITAPPPAVALVVGWAMIALVLALTYFARRLMLVGRLANRRAVTDGALPALLAALRSAVGHRSRVTLTSVNTISSPIALGLHEICVPEAALTQLTVDEQRGLLAHELAHLARRDPVWLDAAALLERVFFFQPLHRLARREIQRNAEFLCDDWAAERTGNGLSLAHCLARVAEWIEASPLGVPVTGMAEQRSLLVTRITRLIEGKRAASPLSRMLVLGGATVLLSGVVAAAPSVRLQDDPRTRLAPVSDTAGQPTSLAGTTRDRQQNVSADSQVNRGNDARRGMSQAVVPRGDSGGAGLPIQDATDENAMAHGADDPDADRADPDRPDADDPEVIAALIERLKDTDAGVRRAAANALGNLRSRAAVPALITASGDRNKDVRMAVCSALGEIGDSRAVQALVRRLTDESADVRYHAIDALGEFADELTASQTPSVHRLLLEVGGQLDEAARIRAKAAELLGEIGDRASIPALQRMLADPSPEVRTNALESLNELKAVLSERDVSTLLRDLSPDVRSAALEYVQEHPDAATVVQLRGMLEDVDEHVREHVVDALAELRSPEARAALRAALGSTDPNVRRRAAEVLGERP